MRIGIDLDDTICRTTEIVQNRLVKYAKEAHLNPLDIMNDEDLKDNFFKTYIEDIYLNAEVKRNVASVIKRLRHRGNEIYIITARGSDSMPKLPNVIEITEQWLKKNNIEADTIISSVYGDTKAEVCKKYNIDLMIDDDPYNYQRINAIGRKCLLFDDREKFDLKNNYVTSWLEIEKYIERNRK